MGRLQVWRIWIQLIISFLLCISFVSATNVEIDINESSSLKELLNGDFSLKANGVLEIHNPSNTSKVYELTIPMELDSLIGFSKISIDNSSSFYEFSFDEVKGYLLGPNETAKVGYSFQGLLTYNIYDRLGNESVFEYYSDDIRMLSKTNLNVEKVEREGIRYNESGEVINYTGENTSNRLVTAGITNPTDFKYFGREIKLYRNTADGSQQYYGSGDLIKTFSNISIGTNEKKKLDYIDSNSVNNSIYWLSSDITLEYDILSNKTTSFSKETSSSSGGGGSGGSSSGGGGNIIDDSQLSDSLLIKKSTDKTTVGFDDIVDVTLTIVNLEEDDVENLTVKDELPDNYELKETSTQAKVSSGEIEFSKEDLNGYSSKSLEYSLQNQFEGKGVSYLQPAELIHKNTSYFSDGVLLINDLLPEKKVFVQKEISFENDEFARIDLRVKNLGSITLEDLLISDEMNNESLVKDISKMFFERGTWRIKELSPGENWEVSYLIERNSNLKTLPNVFGVEQENVFGTMISSGEVETSYGGDSSLIEKAGLFVSIGLLVIYLLF